VRGAIGPSWRRGLSAAHGEGLSRAAELTRIDDERDR